MAAATTLLALLGAPASSACAEEPGAPPRGREVWAGADATANVWLVYSGATLAPFGGIQDDGLRLRAVTGYGQYSYSGPRRIGPISEHRDFDATTAFADVLVGYLKRFDPLTAKAFVGASAIGHSIAPIDPENAVQGLDWGVKAGVELWLNIGRDGWGSLDSYWTSAHDTYAMRLRAGYRVLPALSIGPEAGVNGNAEHDNGRGGLFARYEWDGGELSASGGVSGDIADPTTPYATVNWLTQF